MLDHTMKLTRKYILNCNNLTTINDIKLVPQHIKYIIFTRNLSRSIDLNY